MNLAGACVEGLLWGAAIGVAALVAAVPIARALQLLKGRAAVLAWLILLLPLLWPSLLVGYVYSSRAQLDLYSHPFQRAALYALLMWARLTPLAVLVLRFAPRPLSDAAMHCHRLLRGHLHGFARLKAAAASWHFLLRGPWRVGAAAFAVVFLFAFAEFELASLMLIERWSVRLFDAHAGGLPIGESLRLTVLPVVCEAALVALVLWLLVRGMLLLPRTESLTKRPAGRWTWINAAIGAVYLIAAWWLTIVGPLQVIGSETLTGIVPLFERFAIGPDMIDSVWMAVPAAAVAYLIAGWFVRRIRQGKSAALHGGAALALCVPALLGSLVLSLAVAWVFRLPLLRPAYNTLAPAIVAMTLALLPWALLIRLQLHARRPTDAVHAARLLRGASDASLRGRARRLVRQLQSPGRWWLAIILLYWAYLELVVPAMLAPPGRTPIAVTLHNQIHYGQSQMLSAMICVSLLLPLLVVIVGSGAFLLIFGRRFNV